MQHELHEYLELRKSIRSLQFDSGTFGANLSFATLTAAADALKPMIDFDGIDTFKRDKEILRSEIADHPTINWVAREAFIAKDTAAYENKLREAVNLVKEHMDYQGAINQVGTRMPLAVIDEIMLDLANFKSSAEPIERDNWPCTDTQLMKLIMPYCKAFGDPRIKWVIGNANQMVRVSNDDLRLSIIHLKDNQRKTFGSWRHEFGHAMLESKAADMDVLSEMFFSLPFHEAHAFVQQFYTSEAGAFPVKSPIRVMNSPHFYNGHIAVRYMFEREIFNDPNRLSQKLLSEISYDILGHDTSLFQDVHWSMNLFGYFPAYAVGHVIAAQLHHFGVNMRSIEYLKEHDELEYIKMTTGEDLTTKYFIEKWA